MNFNPVLQKELKVRMRNWKAAGMIAVYLLVLTLVAIFLIINITNDMSTSTNRTSSTVTYGFLATIQFLLIIFIAPALTSGAISGERERQTLDLLLCTKLKPRSIILGKLLSSLSQVILLIVASFPIFATVFIFGGISISNILQLFLLYLVVALFMGCIGLFFSTLIKKTTTSNVVSYGFVLFLLFGTLFLVAMYTQIFNKPLPPTPGVAYTPPKQTFNPLLYFNPLVGFGSLLMDQFGGSASSMGIPFIGSALANTSKTLQPWKVNLIVSFGVSCVLFVFSALRINPLRTKGLFKKKSSKVRQKGSNKK